MVSASVSVFLATCVVESDVTYLLNLNDQTFDAAAVVDYGVGVFAR